MLPIGDDEGQARGPRFVTMALIAINVLAFFLVKPFATRELATA